MRNLLFNKDFEGIKEALSENALRANQTISLDDTNTTKAHPLHRICDGVFLGKYTDEDAVRMATLFLDYGAKIDGNQLIEKQDTPLIAASSLHADQLAIFYIEKGANMHHAGTHGGTALHWAAWCGRHKVVSRLVKEGAEINKQCIDFEATPLFWTIHGLKRGINKNRKDYLECVKILIDAGADKNIPNKEGKTVFDLLHDGDLDFKERLN